MARRSACLCWRTLAAGQSSIYRGWRVERVTVAKSTEPRVRDLNIFESCLSFLETWGVGMGSQRVTQGRNHPRACTFQILFLLEGS